MSVRPLVSVVIPCYNGESTVIRALDQVFSQSITDLEAVVVDDGSSDRSADLVRRYACDHPEFPVILISQANAGPSAARNRGIAASRGEYIAFLDCDDGWHRQKLERQITLMRDCGALLCGTRHAVISPDQLAERSRAVLPSFCVWRRIRWPGILFITPFATPSVVMRRSLGAFAFDERLRRSEDYNLWLRITRLHPAVRIEHPLTFTFKHNYLSSGSLSSDQWAMQREMNRSFGALCVEHACTPGQRVLLALAFAFAQVKFARRLGAMLLHEWAGKMKGMRS